MRSFVVFWLCFLPVFAACTPEIASPRPTTLVLYRFEPPSFLEISADFDIRREIPFRIPPNCGLIGTFPAPVGPFILVELGCPNGQTLLFLNIDTGSVTQPVTDTDSHFLAWTSDGGAAYLKVDSLGSPRVVLARTDGLQDVLPISEFTYDLAARPGSRDFIFTLSRGLGYGSEMHILQGNGRRSQLLLTDQFNYVSFARFSPDGGQIAFIRIPDSQTPFAVGELWAMDSDGAHARKLADADAGHGFAANWSPDGTRIAFVVRENPKDEQADRSSEALISNIYIVEVESGEVTQVTAFEEGRAESPHWSADGNTLAFNVVVADGRMDVQIADIESGQIRSVVAESACCPAWMQK